MEQNCLFLQGTVKFETSKCSLFSGLCFTYFVTSCIQIICFFLRYASLAVWRLVWSLVNIHETKNNNVSLSLGCFRCFEFMVNAGWTFLQSFCCLNYGPSRSILVNCFFSRNLWDTSRSLCFSKIRILLSKELKIRHKSYFSNHYIIATWCFKLQGVLLIVPIFKP